MIDFHKLLKRRNRWEYKLSRHVMCYVNNHYQVDLDKICLDCAKIITKMNYWQKELERRLIRLWIEENIEKNKGC